MSAKRLPNPLRSLQTQILVAIMGIVLLGTGLLAVYSAYQFEQLVISEEHNDLTTTTVQLAARFEEDLERAGGINGGQVDDYLETQANRIDVNLAVYDPSGRFVASSGADQMIDQLAQDSLAENGAVITTSQSTPTDGELLYTVAPILHDNETIGILQAWESTAIARRTIAQQWFLLGLAVAGIIAVALVVGFWLARTLSNPLSELQQLAYEFSGGDLSHRFTTSTTSEVEALGNALNHMAEELQAMIEEQRRFASNASHELRTPLTTVKLRTELLTSGTLDEAIAQQYLTEIDQEMVRLGGLIEDLFLLSRLDSNRIQIGHERVNIPHVAQQVIQEWHPAITEKDLRLFTHFPESPITMRANQNHIRTILRNILENAVKYTPDGGEIIWKITTSQSNIRISIQDTGIGIAPEHIAKVSQRFYRADAAHSRTISGSGLGLTLVHSIVRLYQGTLQIQSDGIGKGTSVTIILPTTI